MKSLANPSHYDGRASLEFLVGAVVVFIPSLVFATVLWTIGNAHFAAEAAVRHGARVFVQHTSLSSAEQATEEAIAHTLDQYGVEGATRVQVRCKPSSQCLAPGSWMELGVQVAVPIIRIPLVPLTTQATLPIQATAVARVSSYRGDP